MDFMKWLNSLDELLYEVMGWLVFFPLTLWRTLIGPLRMMAYADEQLALPQESQYPDALSPPLVLVLALVVAHGVASALGQADALIANRRGLGALVHDDATALVLRLLVFAGFPLTMSVRLVRRRREALTRSSLRAPFYAQCYPAAIFALGLSIGFSLASVKADVVHMMGLAIVTTALLFYLGVQTRWFSEQLLIGRFRGFGIASVAMIQAFVLLLAIGFLFTR